MSETDFEYARVIGEKLRSVRRQRRISLRELAEQANISASMLSQIETGKAYPSVRSIYNIAAALNLPVDYFFPDHDNATSPESDHKQPQAIEAGDDTYTTPSGAMTASELREALMNQSVDAIMPEATGPAMDVAQILHALARPTIQLKGGVTWSRLTAAAESNIEFLEITYACGASSGEYLSHHEGREFGLILEGELVLQLGFKELTLHTGDSIVFDSMTPHRLLNNSNAPVRALWVVWNQG